MTVRCVMAQSDTPAQPPDPAYDVGTSIRCQRRLLRAATFGAMDGLGTNTALIAGVAAAGNAQTVMLSGVAGLLAGAFSMALGEYTSVTTANEQIDSEVDVERRSSALAAGRAGGTHQHARQHRHDRGHRTDRCRRDPSRREPGSQLPSQREIGLDPTEKPSPRLRPSRLS